VFHQLNDVRALLGELLLVEGGGVGETLLVSGLADGFEFVLAGRCVDILGSQGDPAEGAGEPDEIS
jgi:hypothetical protein